MDDDDEEAGHRKKPAKTPGTASDEKINPDQ